MPKPASAVEETQYERYERQYGVDELAFYGHRDKDGNIYAISATSDPPTREGFVQGWMTTEIVEVRRIDGVNVCSKPFYPTREQAEQKVAMFYGEIPRFSGPSLLWEGWADLVPAEAPKQAA